MIEEKIKGLKSPIVKSAAEVLYGILTKLVNEEYTEGELCEIATKLHPAKNGYISNKEVANVERCCKMLGLGTNRAKFYRLVNKYKCKEVTINNQKCGYLISDIEQIKIKEQL